MVDDGRRQEQQEDNKQSSTNQESGDDDENKSGDDDEDEAVSSEEDDNDNEEQAENEDDFGAQQEEEGCSGGMKKRRRFTLQEKLMYLWVVWRKVEKGLSLQEASKSINISHKQIRQMNLVVNVIQDLGVEVEHIPGGCTSLCQPVDIGINKPFKAFLHKAWEKWMINEGIRVVHHQQES